MRAIETRHTDAIEELRAARIAAAGNSTALRDWVSCLVFPLTDHLATLPGPTRYARFAAQVMTDPTYQRVVLKNALESASVRPVADRIALAVPDLPDHVRAERIITMRTLLVHTCAAMERGFADGITEPRADWNGTALGLVDGIVGLWQAPVTDN